MSIPWELEYLAIYNCNIQCQWTKVLLFSCCSSTIKFPLQKSSQTTCAHALFRWSNCKHAKLFFIASADGHDGACIVHFGAQGDVAEWLPLSKMVACPWCQYLSVPFRKGDISTVELSRRTGADGVVKCLTETAETALSLMTASKDSRRQVLYL